MWLYNGQTLAPFLASSSPDGAKSASNQPQNLFSAFHALSPCLTIVTLYVAMFLTRFTTVTDRENNFPTTMVALIQRIRSTTEHSVLVEKAKVKVE